MAKKIKVDTTVNGKRRVRLAPADFRAHKPRKGRDAKHMKLMAKKRDESYRKAPRTGLGKGFRVPGYAVKQLLEVHETSPYARTKKMPMPKNVRDVTRRAPFFIMHPLLADKMIELIEKGYPLGTVCRFIGVRYETFKKWLAIGQEGLNPLYAQFHDRVALADAKAEMNKYDKLIPHERKDWKAVAWQLERRWPEHWARRDATKLDVTFSGTAASQKESLAKSVIDDPEVRELTRKIIQGVETYSLEPEEDIGNGGSSIGTEPEE